MIAIVGLAAPTHIASVPDHDVLAFAPGAFTEAIRTGTARLTFDYGDVVASQEAGTLRLWERPPSSYRPAVADWNYLRHELGGLLFVAQLRDPAVAEKVVAAIRSGDVRHCCTYGKCSKALTREDGTRIAISKVDTITIALLSRSTGSMPSVPGSWVAVRRRASGGAG